jgi:hypothetical protein
VRFEFAVGSLDERADERGFAHFCEHMAFNGSTHLAEGEMVRLMERNGLAFGTDNNATTAFETTTYMFASGEFEFAPSARPPDDGPFGGIGKRGGAFCEITSFCKKCRSVPIWEMFCMATVIDLRRFGSGRPPLRAVSECPLG